MKFLSFPFSPRRLFPIRITTWLAVVVAVPAGWSQTLTYDIRAKTGDKIRAVTGQARQGSFGSPSINDKGNVAYSCALSGDSIGAVTGFSIVYRKKGKSKRAQVAVQSGVPQLNATGTFLFFNDPRTIDNSFLIDTNDSSEVNPVPGTGELFRIARDVAINQRDRIAFAGQLTQSVETLTLGDNGNVTNSSYSPQTLATIGQAIPFGNTFRNSAVTTYLNYFSEILTRTTSINQQSTVPYNGNFRVTPDEFLPGFAYFSPVFGGRLVATTASQVIGLPFFTTFESFTDAIIANNNICFVVANLSETGREFDGIWQGNNPDIQPVVVLGSAAPGGGQFSTFDGKVGPSPKANFAAFIATVSGGSGTRGVFRTNLAGNDIERIAVVGERAPGAPGSFQSFELASVNDRGQVALLANAAGTNSALTGIWLSDPTGGSLELIAIEGQKILVGSVEKTVTRLAFSPVSGLNKKGEVAFTASFTDRTSAVIVAK